jgi:hypothetical protein
MNTPDSELHAAVKGLATLLLPVSEKDLERAWIWKDHDEEGVRFAVFVTFQDLQQLAVRIAADREPFTQAQRILGQYHSQYMDLQAAILGLSAPDSERAPAEGEWPVQRVYEHILGTEINFSLVVRFALEKHRAGAWTPEQITEADETRISGMTEEQFTALTHGSLDNMLAYHRDFHAGLLADFSNITDEELEYPSTFWEDTRFPIRHRLHRFTAHLIQHTIQIDKTLACIGSAPTETKRLIRQLYGALAQAEAALIGTEPAPGAALSETAQMIDRRTREIRAILEK